MKFTLPLDRFREANASMDAALARRSTYPILSCVRIDATEHGIRFSSSDLTMHLTLALPFDVEVPGVVALQSKSLSGFLAVADGELVDVELKDGQLGMSSGNAVARLRTDDATLFPPFPVHGGATSRWVGVPVLKRLLPMICNCVDPIFDPTYTSMQFWMYGLQMASTDSRQGVAINCGYAKTTATEGGTIHPIFLVPTVQLQRLANLLGDDESVGVVFGEKCVWFTAGPSGAGLMAAIQLIEFGPHKDVLKVVRDRWTSEASLRVNRKELEAGLAPMVSEQFVDCTMTFAENRIVIEMRGPYGEMTLTVPCRTLRGPTKTYILNGTMFRKFLHVCPYDELDLSYSGDMEPIVLCSKKDPLFVYAIMPMRNTPEEEAAKAKPPTPDQPIA